MILLFPGFIVRSYIIYLSVLRPLRISHVKQIFAWKASACLWGNSYSTVTLVPQWPPWRHVTRKANWKFIKLSTGPCIIFCDPGFVWWTRGNTFCPCSHCLHCSILIKEYAEWSWERQAHRNIRTDWLCFYKMSSKGCFASARWAHRIELNRMWCCGHRGQNSKSPSVSPLVESVDNQMMRWHVWLIMSLSAFVSVFMFDFHSGRCSTFSVLLQ